MHSRVNLSFPLKVYEVAPRRPCSPIERAPASACSRYRPRVARLAWFTIAAAVLTLIRIALPAQGSSEADFGAQVRSAGDAVAKLLYLSLGVLGFLLFLDRLCRRTTLPPGLAGRGDSSRVVLLVPLLRGTARNRTTIAAGYRRSEIFRGGRAYVHPLRHLSRGELSRPVSSGFRGDCLVSAPGACSPHLEPDGTPDFLHGEHRGAGPALELWCGSERRPAER